jgi:hypothetical protein
MDWDGTQKGLRAGTWGRRELAAGFGSWPKREIDTETEMTSALDEKLKEAIVGELKRQAADKPQALGVSDSPDLFVNGKIDLDALIMVVAGSVAGGP